MIEKTKPARFATEYRRIITLIASRLMATEIAPLFGSVQGNKNVVFDVGANLGVWTKAWLDTFGDMTAAVHMFEPLTINIAEIENRRLAGVFDELMPNLSAKMHVHQMAMGESAGGEITINYNEQDTGLSSAAARTSLLSGRQVELNQSETVSLNSVDMFCKTEGIDHIDLLKVDTEGLELQVVRGAQGMIDAGAIDQVMFEFGLHQMHSRHLLRDFWDIFETAGYKMFRFGLGRRGWMLQPLERYVGGYEELNTINLFLARRA